MITRRQLQEIGVGDTGIRERLRTRRLHRLYRGVYSVGHTALSGNARLMAAVLACGDGAALSHVAAAAHLGFRASSAAVVDVTVPRRSGQRTQKGIRLHRSGRLGREDVAIHEGVPTTTVARTLLDLADVLPRQALQRAMDEADYLRLLDMTALIAVVQRNPGRSGAKLMEATQGAPELTQSALEDRFIAVVERHEIPRPIVGAQLNGYTLDFYWPEDDLIVELDGFAAHGTKSRFESDRRRDRRLAMEGKKTIRLTASALIYDEEAIAAELKELTSRSRASSNPASRARISAARAR